MDAVKIKIKDIKEKKEPVDPVDKQTMLMISKLQPEDNRADFKDYYITKEAFYNSATPFHDLNQDKKRLRLLENGHTLTLPKPKRVIRRVSSAAVV